MRKRQIFIELTSLLDVILIMLFMILMQARNQTNVALAEAEEMIKSSQMAEQELILVQAEKNELMLQYDILQENYNTLGRQVLTDNIVLDNSLVITVSTKDDNSILLETAGRQPIVISYEWNDENYAANSLRTEITNLVNQDLKESIFFVFQYDRSKVYNSEYNLICGIVQDVKQFAKTTGKWLNYIEIDIGKNNY